MLQEKKRVDIEFSSYNRICAVMAEWLRRLTRIRFLIHPVEFQRQLSDGVTRAGSNPAHCEFFLFSLHIFFIISQLYFQAKFLV